MTVGTVAVFAISNAKAISAGVTCCAVLADGSVNAGGQTRERVGHGTTTDSSVPLRYQHDNAVAVAADTGPRVPCGRRQGSMLAAISVVSLVTGRPMIARCQ